MADRQDRNAIPGTANGARHIPETRQRCRFSKACNFRSGSRAAAPGCRRSPTTKTIYYTASSLDGFLATEDDSLAWLFALGTSLEGEQGSDSGYSTFIAGVGALAVGSATYEWLLHNSEQVAAETGSPWPYTQPTWVFTTRRLPHPDGADLRFVRGDVRPVHREMRRTAGAGNLWIVGGGELAGQFHDAGLLDEMVVQIGSATLGRGKPLFPRRLLVPSLRLLGLRRLGAERVELHYLLKPGLPDPSVPPHPEGAAP